MLEEHLRIPRGGVFHGKAWPLLHRGTRQPRRPSDAGAGDLLVVSKIRRHGSDEEVLHTFVTTVTEMTIAGHYDDEPVLVAVIAPMTKTDTAALRFDRGVWDLAVDDDPIVGGLVAAPWVISR